jgi:hypothetical protein
MKSKLFQDVDMLRFRLAANPAGFMNSTVSQGGRNIAAGSLTWCACKYQSVGAGAIPALNVPAILDPLLRVTVSGKPCSTVVRRYPCTMTLSGLASIAAPIPNPTTEQPD